MIPLFAHVQYNNNRVKPHIAPAQHHNNVDEIENFLKEWDRQNNTSRMKNLLKVLWNNMYSMDDMLAKLRNIIIKEEHQFFSKLEIKASVSEYSLN